MVARDSEASNDALQARLQFARRLADPVNVREVEPWISRVDEAERIINAGPFTELVRSYLAYSREERTALVGVLRTAVAGRDRRDGPLLPLIGALAAAFRLAILQAGDDALPQLLETYEHLPQSSAERLWLLSILAETGDARVEHLFARMTPESLTASVSAEMDLFAGIPPEALGDIPYTLENATDEIRSTSERSSRQLKATYEQVRRGCT